MAIATKPVFTLDEFAAELEESARLANELPIARDLQDQITDLIYASVQRNYDESASADGAAWAPHAPMTIRMYGPHPILILSGAMEAASTMSGIGGNYLEVSDRSITTGVTLPYAATHQYGDASRNIPARPFYDLRESYIHEIENLAANYLTQEAIG